MTPSADTLSRWLDVLDRSVVYTRGSPTGVDEDLEVLLREVRDAYLEAVRREAGAA